MRIVADELDAFGVVTNRVAHPPERRAGQRVHRDHADQRPCRDQIVDLDLRAEVPAEEAEQLGAVGGDAGFAAEERPQDQRGGGDEFSDAERDHRKGGAASLCRHPAEQHREDEPGQAADQWHQRQRDRQFVAADDVDGVDHQKAAEAVIDRVTERQHAGLAEQDVVGQREDDRDPDQAESRKCTAGAEHFRQYQQEDRDGSPHPVEFELVGRAWRRRSSA